MTLPLDLVRAATGGVALGRPAARTVFGEVAIDGRAVAPGGLWFAIRGDRFDGHDFAPQAIERGAAGLVVARGRGAAIRAPRSTVIVEVEDTVAALGALARAHRARLPRLRVIGVTGSNGKTTTKELLASILAAHAGDAAVHKTEGNFNNHLGLPLTLLRLGEQHRFAVIEMGMSARGEIAYLAHLAAPEVGVIVNVGPVHLETLGSVDEVARAKGELFAALPAGGCCVLPDGDAGIAAQAEASRAVRKIRFGERAGVEVRIERATPRPEGTEVALRLSDGARLSARLGAVGRHNAWNAAAAAGCAHAVGVSPDAIAAGLAAASPAKHRSQIVTLGGRRVIDDCYNASPLSTGAALDTLAALKEGARAVAILGDMLELGPDEIILHRNMGERAAALGIDLLITIGDRMRSAGDAARAAGMPLVMVRHVNSPEEAAAIAAEFSRPGDYVLVKASRGMKLERVVDALRERFAAPHNDSGGAG